ncbi:PREDICTED: jmjC domain-containing protein 4-like [Amphimedon queenslandica]|uniref:2-oxoglutarate and iron-dependent oxygenase JMJD4 n=1 Tax=Amphimedon queenslandica TaxID=400682 RepID=A0AAN0J2P5_AMPQE|nr:PREDICTED: jmjC domain-containing protein 4-like [Amphimedon queenslandica]|eukprot:XP_019850996.1 PREDICTED: jmjC domain-containing protein 4-like [Amphimedon queenslandica]
MELVPCTISYIEFAEQYLKENRPCLIDQELTASWKARKLWQKGGKPFLEYLKKEFGESQVPVTDCNDIQFSSHPKQTWSFAAYIDYWRQYNISLYSSSDKHTEKRQLYLKDWHFTRDYPNYGLYTTPHVFSIDWLNEVWDQESPGAEDHHQVKDDYRFVYMGPKGTWTPFHVDVFRSYSWSVNVCGLKEWLIYPPGEEKHLRDKYGNLPLDVTGTELQDTSMYPNAHKAIKPLHVIQGIGQAIFVPSGWHHQVKNLEDTISINHNWTNGFGIAYTWKYLKTELILVEKEIDDCRSMEGWSEQCQVILRSDAGMNINDFYHFILKIIHPRLERLKKLTEASKQGMPSSSINIINN